MVVVAVMVVVIVVVVVVIVYNVYIVVGVVTFKVSYKITDLLYFVLDDLFAGLTKIRDLKIKFSFNIFNSFKYY